MPHPFDPNIRFFDIETRPLPEEELKLVVPDFDEGMCAYGNAKKPETRERMFEEQREAYWPKVLEKAALKPETGAVLAFGWETMSDTRTIDELEINPLPRLKLTIHTRAIMAERKLLRHIWQWMESVWGGEDGPLIAGWNIIGFDLPFLVRRSWYLKVTYPTWVYDARRNRFNGRFFDLMTFCSHGEYKAFLALDAMAKRLGAGTKTENEVTGATFHEYWARGGADRKKARLYLRQDIMLPRRIWERVRARDV